jgi:hypothetical protein
MNAALCRKCRRTCKQMAWAKIVNCPAFIKREGGEKSEKVTAGTLSVRKRTEGAGVPAPDGAGEEEENLGGKNE